MNHGARTIEVTRKEIARAGGVRVAVEEALSLAALGMTPRAMTAYEAVGMTQTEEDGADILVQVEVENERELREAVVGGAGAIVLVGVGEEEAERLRGIAAGLHGDVRIAG